MDANERKKRKAKRLAKQKERYPNGNKYLPPMRLVVPNRKKPEDKWTAEEAYTMRINPACTGMGRSNPLLSVEDWVYYVTKAVEKYGLAQVLLDIVSVLRMTCHLWFVEHPEDFKPSSFVPTTHWGEPVPPTALKFDDSAVEATRIAMLCPIFCGIQPFKPVVPTKTWVLACVTEFNSLGIRQACVDMLAALKRAYGERGVPMRKLVIFPSRSASLLTRIPFLVDGQPVHVVKPIRP